MENKKQDKSNNKPAKLEPLVFKIIRANKSWTPDEVFQTLSNIKKIRDAG